MADIKSTSVDADVLHPAGPRRATTQITRPISHKDQNPKPSPITNLLRRCECWPRFWAEVPAGAAAVMRTVRVVHDVHNAIATVITIAIATVIT